MKIFKTEDLELSIRNRFCPPGYAFLPQVRNGTGYAKRARTADAIAMSLWPSRGLHLNGFEIKIYRNDWLKELKDPAKAEEIAQYCHFWWVVAPKDIVKIEEVPPAWGLLNPSGTTLKIVKNAEELKPKSINYLFLAAILRQAQESITSEAKIRAAIMKGQEQGEKRSVELFEFERKDHQILKDKIAAFEKASGIHIKQGWRSGKEIGDAVRQVLNGEHTRIKERLARLLESAESIVSDIKENLK